ncbi:MAG TPA: DUF308 domain-containing protein [Methylomirabilota bacterium]|nr:DUF308 domain-containing protein [Methylomirabilota bacterium]
MNSWLWWLVGGAVSVLGGVLALSNPLGATMAAERIAGWFFILAGALQIFSAFREKAVTSTVWAALVGAAVLFVGVALLANPLEGVISLTLLVAILLAVTGVAKILMALRMRGSVHFWVVLGSGLLSIVLAVMIFTNFPQSAAVILGLFLAVELLSNGAAMIALGLLRREAVSRTGPGGRA